MNKRLFAFVLTIWLALFIPHIPVNAAVKAGSACKILGMTTIDSGKTFKCIKSGNKLIWDKGNVTNSSNSTYKDAYSPPNRVTDNIEKCKINEVKVNGPRASKQLLPTGFPSVTPQIQNTGTVKWAIIPIDFPDLKGDIGFKSRIDNQMKLLSEWYSTVSEGRFNVEWSVLDNWVTLPQSTSNYSMQNSGNLVDGSNGAKLFKDAMTASDPLFDFTNIQTVNFILPKGQKFVSESIQGFPSDDLVNNLSTNEGKISSFSIAGSFFDQIGREYWSYWAHEFGHAISIAHVGSSRGETPPFSPFTLMGAQDGPSRELAGWLRFLENWLPDEKIYCKEKSNVNNDLVTLVPLSSSSVGLKMVVVPLSETKAVIIESRRFTKFSCGITSKNGVLVYTYDANLVHNEDFLMPIYPANRSKEYNNTRTRPCAQAPIADPLLYQGDKVVVDGVKIENLVHGNFDKVRISKVS